MTAHRRARRSNISSCNQPDKHSRRNLRARYLPTPAGGRRSIGGGHTCDGATRCQWIVLARVLDYFLSELRAVKKTKTPTLVTGTKAHRRAQRSNISFAASQMSFPAKISKQGISPPQLAARDHLKKDALARAQPEANVSSLCAFWNTFCLMFGGKDKQNNYTCFWYDSIQSSPKVEYILLRPAR